MSKSGEKKKVLIITYYWPPSGGGGVQRWLKFVKYLRNFGWEPVIYTHSNGEVPVIDNSLEAEVPDNLRIIKRPIKEPYSLYKKLTGRKASQKVQTGFLSEGKKPGLMQKVATWIRGNFFIPDARCFWIKPSVKYLSKVIPKINPDLIVSTGPPHSMHMIALGLSKRFSVPWIADFRDPWTNIDYYPRLMLTRWADYIHRKMEHKVVSNCDLLLTVSKTWAKDFEKLGAKQTAVITNGFDPDDFNIPEDKQPEPGFTLSHIGYLNEDRNPKMLWQTLAGMANSNASFSKQLRIKLIGKTDHAVIEELNRLNLTHCTEIIDYLPHKEVIREYKNASVLLLLLSNTPEAKGRIPGKLFEYLAARRPVLSVGPEDGDAADILRETGAGQTVNFSDSNSIQKHLWDLFENYRSDNLELPQHSIAQYQRDTLTKKLSACFDLVT